MRVLKALTSVKWQRRGLVIVICKRAVTNVCVKQSFSLKFVLQVFFWRTQNPVRWVWQKRMDVWLCLLEDASCSLCRWQNAASRLSQRGVLCSHSFSLLSKFLLLVNFGGFASQYNRLLWFWILTDFTFEELAYVIYNGWSVHYNAWLIEFLSIKFKAGWWTALQWSLVTCWVSLLSRKDLLVVPLLPISAEYARSGCLWKWLCSPLL